MATTVAATPSLTITTPDSSTNGQTIHHATPKYLPASSLGPSQKDLATNASSVPPRPRSASAAPTHTAILTSSQPHGKDVDSMLAQHRPGSYDAEDAHSEKPRVVRSRALRLNTLHQRAYHNDNELLSPLSHGGVLEARTESEASDKSSTSALSEKDQLLFSSVGGSPQSQVGALQQPSIKTRFYLHRRLSSPERSLSFSIPKQLRTLLPRSVSRRLSRFSTLGDSPSLWLSLYFVLNLTLTLYNKTVLIHFPFPYTLTALHAFCGTIGTSVLLRMNPGVGMGAKGPRSLTAVSPSSSSGSSSYQPVPNLNGKELLVLFLFSILYTLNIIVSNASLRLVTVPFHQVVRASTPFFTILFAAVLLKRRCSKNKLLSLIPVVVGVGFATYGDYYFTAFGFFLTLFGTILAALKTILTNVILVKPSPAFTSSSGSLANGGVAISSSGLPIATSPDSPFFPHHHHSHSHSHSHHTRDSSISYKSKRAYPPSFFSSLISLTINHLFPPSPSSSPAYPTKELSHGPMPALVSPVNEKYSVSADRDTLTLSTPSTTASSLFDIPKLSLSPIHLLYLLSPLAFIQTTILAQVTGELDRVRWHLFGLGGDASAGGLGIGGGANVLAKGRGWLLLNGVFAFALNVVSFNANRRVGPLGMSVAANVKQVLTVLCAVTIFDLTITPANGLGIVLTLVGGAIYAVVELKEKNLFVRATKSRTG